MPKFLSNLISGIVGFITGLFKPKKGDFFIEVEDNAPATSAPKADKAVPSAEPVATVVEAPAPAPVSVAPAPAPAPAATLNLPAPAVSFADVAMNPASGVRVSRRRPGANMTSFLNMARQVSAPR